MHINDLFSIISSYAFSVFITLYRLLTKDRPLTCSTRETFRTYIVGRRMTWRYQSCLAFRIRGWESRIVVLQTRACHLSQARMHLAHLSSLGVTFKINSFTALTTIMARQTVTATNKWLARNVVAAQQTSPKASSPMRAKAIIRARVLTALIVRLMCRPLCRPCRSCLSHRVALKPLACRRREFRYRNVCSQLT